MEEKETYTLEEVTQMKNDMDKQVQDLQQQLQGLQAKLPKEPSEQELKLQQKEQELFNKQVELTLKENGLEAFTGIVNVQDEDSLSKTVESLQQAVNGIKASNGYVPSGKGQDDQYSQAEKTGDVGKMLDFKFSKLFGN